MAARWMLQEPSFWEVIGCINFHKLGKFKNTFVTITSYPVWTWSLTVHSYFVEKNKYILGQDFIIFLIKTKEVIYDLQ